MCHITPVLRELHWLPVQFRIQFKFIVITFKAINGQGPMYQQELVKLQQDGAYNLRSSNKGHVLQAPNAITKKTLGDRAYICVQHLNFGTVFPIMCVTRSILVNSKFY